MNKDPVLQQIKNKQNQPYNNKSSLPIINFHSNKSSSDRNSDKKIVDMIRLMKTKQRSRISQIDIFEASYGLKRKQNPVHPSQLSPFESSYNLQQNFIDNDERISALQQESQNIKVAQFDQTFLSNNQNNIFVGFLLYCSFIILITIQVIGTTYYISKQSQSSFYFQNALLTILFSQLIYYIIARYINNLASNRFFFNSSPVTSYKKLMVTLYNKHIKVQRNIVQHWLFSKPYLILIIFSFSVIVCQLIYSWLTTSSNYLQSFQKQNYMISSIFWGYFALPFLFTNFYWNRPIEKQNFKIKIFPYLIYGYMFYSLFQGYLFIILIIFRLIHDFIISKQQLDGFHMDQLCKGGFLIVIIIFTLIKYYKSQDNQQIYYLQFKLIWDIIRLTIAMMISRIIASIYIKQQLYKYFYTQMHINMAYIYATLLLLLSYLYLLETLQHQTIINMIVSIIFLLIFGSILYLDGQQKMIITMQLNLEQQKN